MGGGLKIEKNSLSTDKRIIFNADHTAIEPVYWFYADPVNGVDADDRGSEEKPFRSIQYAVNFMASMFDIRSHSVFALALKPGDYTANEPEYIRVPGVSGMLRRFVISSEDGDPKNIIVPRFVYDSPFPTVNYLRGVTIKCTDSNAPYWTAVTVQKGCYLNLDSLVVDISSVTGNLSSYLFNADYGSKIVVSGTWSSGADLPVLEIVAPNSGATILGIYVAANQSGIVLASGTVKCNKQLTFTSGAVMVDNRSYIRINSGVKWEVTGVGKKYYIVNGNMRCGNVSALPGNQDGTTNKTNIIGTYGA